MAAEPVRSFVVHMEAQVMPHEGFMPGFWQAIATGTESGTDTVTYTLGQDLLNGSLYLIDERADPPVWCRVSLRELLNRFVTAYENDGSAEAREGEHDGSS